jgi:hypothetical protein
VSINHEVRRALTASPFSSPEVAFDTDEPPHVGVGHLRSLRLCHRLLHFGYLPLDKLHWYLDSRHHDRGTNATGPGGDMEMLATDAWEGGIVRFRYRSYVPVAFPVP